MLPIMISSQLSYTEFLKQYFVLNTQNSSLSYKNCSSSIPWRRAWQATPVFLPGESHRQRNLVDYSPWGHKQLDMTEWLSRAQHMADTLVVVIPLLANVLGKCQFTVDRQEPICSWYTLRADKLMRRWSSNCDIFLEPSDRFPLHP